MEVYQIDKHKSIKAAEAILKQYRTFKIGYRLQSTISSKDNVERKLYFIQTIEKAVDSIENKSERKLLREVYMGDEKLQWLVACNCLFLDKSRYYELRKFALISFAICLNIEVYET